MNLKENIEKVIDQSGAKIGVAVRHIESGEETMINADSLYPLASVVKIPILVEACFQMSEDHFRPTDRWVLKTEDKNLPSGVLVFFEDGLTPTALDIMTMMIIISDNTATDILLKRVTKEKVVKRMRSLGLNDIHVTMSVRELFEDLLPCADPTMDPIELEQLIEKTGTKENTKVYKLTPENNVSSPRDMVDLVCKVYNGQIPDRKWSDFALNILLKQQLNDRIPRYLPNNVRCAHKTGTLEGIRNDSGIIYARNDSHIALSLFTIWDEKSVSKDPKADREGSFALDSAMGEIARLAFEAYK
jgi:beta-lactamase class A